MAYTDFSGLSVNGVPILPGLGGIPFGSGRAARTFWLAPGYGSDNNDGLTPDTALDTMAAAYAKCTTEIGDVINWVAPDGGTDSSSRDTANIAWSKSGITVNGICAPVHVSQRARVAPSTSFAGALITVSGHNNLFRNFQMFQGHNAASTCLEVTGQRNVFENVHVAGIGHATAGDDAASESLLLTGSENLFVGCTIGITTINRSAATAELRITTAATRNKFVDCVFETMTDAATPLWVDIPDSGGMDRYTWFENCKFFNPIDSTSTVITVGMNIHASCGGTVVLKDCMRYGATDWAQDFANLATLSLNSGTAATDMGAAINGS